LHSQQAKITSYNILSPLESSESFHRITLLLQPFLLAQVKFTQRTATKLQKSRTGRWVGASKGCKRYGSVWARELCQWNMEVTAVEAII